MSIANLSSPNPFDDNTNDTEDKGMSPANGQGIVHLRIQKRNGRKSVTTISGLPKGLKVDKYLFYKKTSEIFPPYFFYSFLSHS